MISKMFYKDKIKGRVEIWSSQLLCNDDVNMYFKHIYSYMYLRNSKKRNEKKKGIPFGIAGVPYYTKRQLSDVIFTT